MEINKIIKENIQQLINEKLTSIIYHYTTIGRLANILKTNAIKLQASVNGNADKIDNNNFFYLSFTRQKSSKLGYSRHKNVRICFDGDLLNNNFKGGSYNYWGGSMGKHYYFNKKNIDYFQPNTENEDRLYSKKPIIENIQKYIKRIDILIDLKRLEDVKTLLDINYNEKIFIYDNNDDFDAQKNNITWDDLYQYAKNQSFQYNMHLQNENQTIIKSLTDIILFILLLETDDNSYIENANKLLKQYNLSRFSSQIMPQIKRKLASYYNISDICENMSNAIKKLHTDIDNIDIYNSVANMLYDYCNKRNIKSTSDAINYKLKLVKNKNISYDTNKVIKGYKLGAYFVYDLKNTNIWDIVPKDAINEFPDTVYNYVVIQKIGNDHKSKNDEYFYKYLQHLVKNKLSISDMFTIMKNLGLDVSDMENILWLYEIQPYEINWLNYDRVKYVNKKQKDYIINIFEQ